MLRDFCILLPAVYTERCYTVNSHLLLHVQICPTVGPLWQWGTSESYSCSNGSVKRTLVPVVLNVGNGSTGKWFLHIVPTGTPSSKVECSATIIICGIQFALALRSASIELEGDIWSHSIVTLHIFKEDVLTATPQFQRKNIVVCFMSLC